MWETMSARLARNHGAAVAHESEPLGILTLPFSFASRRSTITVKAFPRALRATAATITCISCSRFSDGGLAASTAGERASNAQPLQKAQRMGHAANPCKECEGWPSHRRSKVKIPTLSHKTRQEWGTLLRNSVRLNYEGAFRSMVGRRGGRANTARMVRCVA